MVLGHFPSPCTAAVISAKDEPRRFAQACKQSCSTGPISTAFHGVLKIPHDEAAIPPGFSEVRQPANISDFLKIRCHTPIKSIKIYDPSYRK